LQPSLLGTLTQALPTLFTIATYITHSLSLQLSLQEQCLHLSSTTTTSLQPLNLPVIFPIPSSLSLSFMTLPLWGHRSHCPQLATSYLLKPHSLQLIHLPGFCPSNYNP
ncbi:hypothetical protein DFJ73DRAFT_833881, partial [Zopfochytrium polystomum]